MRSCITKTLALGVLAGVGVTDAQEARNDLLLRKLVEKGVLTQKEADQMKLEAEREQYVLWQQAPDLPAWVDKMSMSGDLRLRYETFNSAGGGGTKPARERFRYRFRYGISATVNEDWLLGFRLASGGTGDPTSTNETMDDDGANDTLTIDRAYAAWTPADSLTLSFGKMPNPMGFDSAVMDGDYTPEGIGLQWSTGLAEDHILGINAMGIVVNESSTDSSDAYAGFLRSYLDSSLSDKLSSTVGLGMYNIFNKEAATDAGGQSGNTGGNAPTHNFNPIIADAALTYKLDSFPGYEGAFPIKMGGSYIHNPGASEKNNGYMAGITFGKAKAQGSWEIGWQYRELQADSLYDNWVDSDFGAYGVGADANSYKGGTDARGHLFKAKYQISSSMQFSATISRVQSITTNAHPSTRGQFDLIWKF